MAGDIRGSPQDRFTWCGSGGIADIKDARRRVRESADHGKYQIAVTGEILTSSDPLAT
jgi:hypothetical protein